MKTPTLLIATLLLVGVSGVAQVAINSDNISANCAAMLDVKSTTKGILIPRMTQGEIEAISGPVNGLVVFYTSLEKFFVYLASQNKWQEMAYGPFSINPGGGFSCGNLITVNHTVSGGVAPVDKSTSYGTVENIPGEPSKCWITNNLGSDQQASSVDDATESSAGWYWQFNRKQGNVEQSASSGTVRSHPHRRKQFCFPRPLISF